jgi:hypothetical protein
MEKISPFCVTKAVEYFSACDSHHSTGEEDLPICAITLLTNLFILLRHDETGGERKLHCKKDCFNFSESVLLQVEEVPSFLWVNKPCYSSASSIEVSLRKLHPGHSIM